MRKLILAAVIGAGVTAPAIAQDTNEAFTGFRVEAIGGYDITNSDNDGDFSPGTDDMFDDGEGGGLEGFLYGVGVGFDFSAGGFLVGAEAEISDSTAGESENDALAPGSVTTFEAERDFYVGGRLGAVVSPSALIYAKGGYTNARYGLDADDGAGFIEDYDNSLDGFRVGAGVEYLLSGNAFAKVEYRYSNYSDLEVDVGDDNIDFADFDVNTDRHQVIAGVGLRF